MMPLNVQAEIIDISIDQPKAQDRFFVDSNVWFWVGYSRVSMSGARPYQTKYYPNYLTNALNSQSTLLKCVLSFSELAHTVEKTEWEIFKRLNPTIGQKDFRHNYPAERAKVVTEIQYAWALADAMTNQTSLPINIDQPLIDVCLQDLQTHELDGYDLMMVHALRQSGITQVITDDGDFAQVPNLQVFTANKNVIQVARSQGKLITR